MNLLRKIVEKLYFRIPYNLALYDQQTGLYNRNWWDMVGKNKYKDKCVYLTFIDVNNLKKINDTKGHNAGDRLLKNVAERLDIYLADSELIHLSGDEFLLVSAIDPSSTLKEICFNEFCYGCYQKHTYEDIHEACKIADGLMYQMKRESKKGRDFSD